MTTLERLKNLIASQLYIPEADITEASTWKELGADSLDVVEMAIQVEEEFEINIGNEALDKLKTVGDLLALVNKLAPESVLTGRKGKPATKGVN